MPDDIAVKPRRPHRRTKPLPPAIPPAPLAPTDPLEAFVAHAEEGDFSEAIMAILWKQRHENPEFALEIHPTELKGLKDCVEYLGVTPVIRIHRPGGVPAQEGRPATANRSAVPPRAAIPPKNYVVVQMLDQDGNAFKPIENTQESRERQIKADNLRHIRDTALSLANQLQTDVQNQTVSNATTLEAVAALRALAGAT